MASTDNPRNVRAEKGGWLANLDEEIKDIDADSRNALVNSDIVDNQKDSLAHSDELIFDALMYDDWSEVKGRISSNQTTYSICYKLTDFHVI